ncbi:MAG: hypothetical protein R3C68_00465 [Myxococcota bacterium]
MSWRQICGVWGVSFMVSGCFAWGPPSPEPCDCASNEVCFEKYFCVRLCTQTQECSEDLACFEGHCVPYQQSCADSAACIEGFGCLQGDCVKLYGECLPDVPDTCDPLASCAGTGPYDCLCPSGYEGDGRSCEDIDECARGTDTCRAPAQCFNSAGSFTCACPVGTLDADDGMGCVGSWESFALGDQHACGIRNDGSLWCWGDNTVGQLGDGSSRRRSVPVRVGQDNTWQQVSAGSKHTCGVHADGSLQCFGSGNNGRLGHGAFTAAVIPTTVDDSRRWSAVAAGGRHSCAIAEDSRLWCWGSTSHIAWNCCPVMLNILNFDA